MAKIAKVYPLKTLCVDIIGPYKFNQKGSKPVQLWAVTMIDRATGWFEIKWIKTKGVYVVANIVKHTWITQ